MWHEEITRRMSDLADDRQAVHLMRFFKTGKGQYGEGDKFLGIKVPVTRSIVKQYKDLADIEDAGVLIYSEWHEIRLLGFLLLIEFFKKARRSRDCQREKQILDFYLANLDRGNNWDLVDLVAPKILGEWIVSHPGDTAILYMLSDECNLWKQRVSIVSTYTLIREGMFDPTIRIARKFIDHKHDLIHKATGWMLREVGKRGGKKELVDFLKANGSFMPRTMYRYAIEHLRTESPDMVRHFGTSS